MTPADCLQQRFDAHCRGDYAALYATYHPEAPFLHYFPELDDYLSFARENLSAIQLRSWRCTMERRLDEQQTECLQIIEFVHGGLSCQALESALLLHTAKGWLYHSAQKIDPDTLSVPLTQVDFSHFDQAADKVRF